MRQLHSITRSFSLPTARPPTRALLTLTNHYNQNYSTTTQKTTSPRPKILDAAGQYDGNPREVEKHNKEFENRGSAVPQPPPKIHSASGVFDGEKRDVERQKQEFRERHDREE